MTYDKKLRCGVFIDGSNVLWGSLNMKKDDRWFVDYAKLKDYLKDRYKPQFYKFYGAIDTKPKTDVFVRRAAGQAKMYAKLEGMGYDVITKPLKYIRQSDGTFKTKGDMDIELTMGIMAALDDLDTIVLLSGDCDYHTPVKSFHAQGKYIRILSFDNLLSWELRTFAMNNTRCSFKILDELKEEIMLQPVDKTSTEE
ncbi:MAG: NYN domain-containing protein [Candidatus Saccharimonadales bacterium]